MANQKNPTALFIQRMYTQGIASGAKPETLVTLAGLLQQWFILNVGKVQLPKQVSDATLYDSRPTSGAINLLFFSGAFNTNNSNMPSGTFQNNESEHFVILGLRAYEGVQAAIAATPWEPGLRTPALINGNLSLNVNGQRQLRNIAMTNFNTNALSATSAGVTSDDQGFFYLIEPIAWLAQTSIEIPVAFPVAPATPNLNLRIELHGLQFIG